MRLARFMLGCIFTILLTSGQANAGTGPSIHLVQLFDDGVYALDVSYNVTAQLRISCIEDCKHASSFSEEYGFFLLGAYGDGDTFITLWSGGSVEWIVIYRIHGGSITKVLQQPSRTLPAFASSSDGRRVIILHNDTAGMYIGKELYGKPPGLTRADRLKIRKETTSYWVWNGTTYVPYDGNVLDGWQTIK